MEDAGLWSLIVSGLLFLLYFLAILLIGYWVVRMAVRHELRRWYRVEDEGYIMRLPPRRRAEMPAAHESEAHQDHARQSDEGPRR